MPRRRAASEQQWRRCVDEGRAGSGKRQWLWGIQAGVRLTLRTKRRKSDRTKLERADAGVGMAVT